MEVAIALMVWAAKLAVMLVLVSALLMEDVNLYFKTAITVMTIATIVSALVN